MNNQAIERKAIAAIYNLVDNAKYLNPEIPCNDKSPIWDGYIYRYSETNLNNGSFSGRVPIQLKGKEVTVLDGDTTKFPVRICDLNAYAIDGGSIFFVVQVKKDSEYAKVYYRKFHPVDIEEILLRCKKNQQTITLEFDTIGLRGRYEILSVVDSFLHHRFKLAKNSPRATVIEDKANIHFTMFTTNKDALHNLLYSPQYLFTKVSNVENEIFYDKFYTKEIRLKVLSNVEANNNTFYVNPTRIISKNHDIIIMGKYLRYDCLNNLLIIDSKGGKKLDLNTYNFLCEIKKIGFFSIGKYAYRFNRDLMKELILKKSEENIE